MQVITCPTLQCGKANESGDNRRLQNFFDLICGDSWRNVYAGESRVRPPAAPTTDRQIDCLTEHDRPIHSRRSGCHREQTGLWGGGTRVRIRSGIRQYVEAEIGGDSAETTSLVAPTDGVTTAHPVGAAAHRCPSFIRQSTRCRQPDTTTDHARLPRNCHGGFDE